MREDFEECGERIRDETKEFEKFGGRIGDETEIEDLRKLVAAESGEPKRAERKGEKFADVAGR